MHLSAVGLFAVGHRVERAHRIWQAVDGCDASVETILGLCKRFGAKRYLYMNGS